MFKESSPLSSLNTSLSEPDLRTAVDDEEDKEDAEEEDEDKEDGDSEDEGWYSLSRTDLRKVEGGVLKGGQVSLVVLANCSTSGQHGVESSQERNSYRYHLWLCPVQSARLIEIHSWKLLTRSHY